MGQRSSQGNCTLLQGNGDIVAYEFKCTPPLGLSSLGALASDFVSNIGLQAYDTKMMAQRSLLAFCFQVGGRAPKSMMTATFTYVIEKAFSDVLECVVLKYFSGGKLLDPHLLTYL